MVVPPSVIIIGGICGSGKSTIGKKLAEKIGYTFADADDFHTEENKAKMSRGESLQDADRAPWLTRVREIWTNGGTSEKFVVACSALKRKYRSFLLDEDQTSKREKVIIMLIVPQKILTERTVARNDHFAKSNLIPSQMADFEPPPENGGEFRVMTIDGTRAINDVVQEIMDRTGV